MTDKTDLEGVRARVLMILKKYPRARSNYPFLVLAYWNEYDGSSFMCPSLEVLQELTSPESINRASRALMKDHPELRPPPSVQELRAQMEEAHRRTWR